METTTISILTTSNENILKFEANKFLTNHESFEFDSIDEAKSSPLAQELFYLPFIKKVYISGNFVALERYDIVEWADVQDDVAEQIANYINSGKRVVSESETPQTTPTTVYAESTPNPTALKFVVNKRLVATSYEFVSPEDTHYGPLAKELFQFPYVKNVFIDENFISITKHDSADWNDITTALRDFLKHYIESGKDIISANAPKVVKQAEEIHTKQDNYDDISKEIISILDEYVKPAVANDGGNIEFQSYDPNSKVIKVILQGACSGCPSSTYTLKNGIETMLKEMLKDKDLSVEAING